MAKKLSINIDLTDSRHTGKQQTPVEYNYRYDRIIVLIAAILIVLFGIFGLFLLFSEDEVASLQVPQQKQRHDITIKEKHLSVSETPPIRPHSHLVYVFYEQINVLETFYFSLNYLPLNNLSLNNLSLNNLSLNNLSLNNLSLNKENSEQTNPGLKQEIKEAPTEKNKPVIEQYSFKEKEKRKIIEAEVASTPLNKKPENKKTVPAQNKKPAESLQNNDNDFIQINSKNLSRVLLVSNIYKKEPLNELSYSVSGVKDHAKKVYLFTQIDNSIGQTIEHQWWYQETMVNKKSFTVSGKRWRCYSSKNIGKLQQGKWLVKIIDQKGNILSTVNFQYQVN